MEGRILRIEKISPNDGSGLRTVVFLKGCPLRCKWCSTPESQSGETELFYKQAKCIHCGRCIQVCPRQYLLTGVLWCGTGKSVSDATNVWMPV